jgi:hypothetical protein
MVVRQNGLASRQFAYDGSCRASARGLRRIYTAAGSGKPTTAARSTAPARGQQQTDCSRTWRRRLRRHQAVAGEHRPTQTVRLVRPAASRTERARDAESTRTSSTSAGTRDILSRTREGGGAGSDGGGLRAGSKAGAGGAVLPARRRSAGPRVTSAGAFRGCAALFPLRAPLLASCCARCAATFVSPDPPCRFVDAFRPAASWTPPRGLRATPDAGSICPRGGWRRRRQREEGPATESRIAGGRVARRRAGGGAGRSVISGARFHAGAGGVPSAEPDPAPHAVSFVARARRSGSAV